MDKDIRNIIDYYHYWTNEAIKADLVKELKMKYYKYMFSGVYEYYRVHPDNTWDFWSKALQSYPWLNATQQEGWCPWTGWSSKSWNEEKANITPIEVSKLEILLILGPKGVK